MRAKALVTVVVAALAVAGCGGASDEEQVRTTVEDYIIAFVDGDGDKACDLLTKETRDAFVQQVSSLVKTRDCGEAIKKLGDLAGPTVDRALKGAKVTEVKVNGENATATLESRGTKTPTQLKKEDGDWKISDVPGA